jgi:hypothetical protein
VSCRTVASLGFVDNKGDRLDMTPRSCKKVGRYAACLASSHWRPAELRTEWLAVPGARDIKIACFRSGCVSGEDEVARSLRVARGAGLELGLGAGFTVFVEMGESPAARRGVFF